MLNVYKDYIDLARKKHLRQDITFVFCFSFFISFILYFFDVRIDKSDVASFTNVMITAFSILTGFNMTTLSIFATSKSPIKIERIQDSNRVNVEQVFAYFAWSIVAQLLLVFCSIVFSFLLTFGHTVIPYQTNLSSIPFLLGISVIKIGIILLVYGITYSLLLTFRNISILYRYLIAQARNERKSSN